MAFKGRDLAILGVVGLGLWSLSRGKSRVEDFEFGVVYVGGARAVEIVTVVEDSARAEAIALSELAATLGDPGLEDLDLVLAVRVSGGTLRTWQLPPITDSQLPQALAAAIAEAEAASP